MIRHRATTRAIDTVLIMGSLLNAAYSSAVVAKTGDGQYAVVDMQAVILNVKEGKEARESLEKEIKEKEKESEVMPYRLTIDYTRNYESERLLISYAQQLKGYMKEHIKSKEDMSNRVPLKWLNILPENVMGGVLGFTYLGENFMGRRADLVGKTARMVDIHESIHTPDEYETRILTSWIMEKMKTKYVK